MSEPFIACLCCSLMVVFVSHLCGHYLRKLRIKIDDLYRSQKNRCVGVEFCKLDPDAKIPVYKHADDSGMDVSTIDSCVIPPHSFAKLRTGIAARIPRGFEIQVRPRSGLQCVSGVVGAWGTVDEGYRGDIGVALYNHSDVPFSVQKGDRVAQLVIAPVFRADVKCVGLNEFDVMTDRGSAGFGSTGK